MNNAFCNLIVFFSFFVGGGRKNNPLLLLCWPCIAYTQSLCLQARSKYFVWGGGSSSKGEKGIVGGGRLGESGWGVM